jgi:hypothetical protein
LIRLVGLRLAFSVISWNQEQAMSEKRITEVQKRGASTKKGGSTYVLRDALSGEFVTIESTRQSATVLKQSASKNSRLLNRLAKR